MRILILGGGSINKGAEAMLRTVQAELGRRLPGAEFYIGDGRANQWEADELVAAGVPLAPVRLRGKAQSLVRLGSDALRSPEGPWHWLRRRTRHRYLDAMTGAVDGAVDVSGFLFSDQMSVRAASHLADIVEMFDRGERTTALLPQAWGPFENPSVRHEAVRACTHADVVYARDEISYEHLRQILGGDIAKVERAPDIAFLFQPAPNGRDLVAELGLDPDRPIAAIAPNMRVYERTQGEGVENTYVRILTRVGEGLRGQGAQVLLLPHEIRPDRHVKRDDRFICGVLASHLGAEGVAAVQEDRPAEDLKAMVAQCDVMLGSRFHALVASLSSGVPSVAIGWAHKYPELFREFDLERLVLDHDSLTEDALAETVQEVWEERGALREQIRAALPPIKARSASVFDRVASLLDQTHR